MPKAEEVCQVNTGFCLNKEYFNTMFKGCTSIPIPVFQMSKFLYYKIKFNNKFIIKNTKICFLLKINKF